MAKDPAFLFYPGDFMGGTMGFSRHVKGAYVDLMMAQFNIGRMTLDEVKDVLGEDDFNKYWESKLKKKFTDKHGNADDKGKYYNNRLEYEIEKRKSYGASRRGNLGEHASPGHKKGNVRPKAILDVKIPTEEEFLKYCETELGTEYPSLKAALSTKYKTFKDNGWKDGFDKKIKNWKNKIKNVIPHLKPHGNGRRNNTKGSLTETGVKVTGSTSAGAL